MDEDPGTPEIWQRAQVIDSAAMKPQPNPFAELMVDGATTLSNVKGLERRFGPFVDVLLRRRSLVVDATTRVRLLPLVAEAMGLNRPQFAGGSKVSMDGAYGKK